MAPEREVIEACKQRDSHAFREIYQAYKDRVYSMASHMTGDAEVARDITQQVFLKVFTSISSFNHKGSFASWLFRVTINLCLDHRRSNSPAQWVSADDLADRELAPNASVSSEETYHKRRLAEAVQNVIMKLSPKLRSVIVLKYNEDLSYSEIADLLGCSVGTVSSRLNRSHKILAEELKHFKNSV